MSRLRPGQQKQCICDQFSGEQAGCERLQATELNHDAHLKTSTMSHPWLRKVEKQSDAAPQVVQIGSDFSKLRGPESLWSSHGA